MFRAVWDSTLDFKFSSEFRDLGPRRVDVDSCLRHRSSQNSRAQADEVSYVRT